jgi:glyoxylase-like metal-dependent hydrolase (beta-lactamase superfamily II)
MNKKAKNPILVRKEKFVTTKVTKSIYAGTQFPGGRPGYIVTDKGVVMIEGIEPSYATTWRKEMESHGKIIWQIHTEGHGDHVRGDFLFMDVPMIIAEPGIDEIKQFDKKFMEEQYIKEVDPPALPMLDKFEIKLPSLTFTQEMKLYFGSITIHLINVPSHSKGQTVIFIPEEKVVFTGDVVNYHAEPALGFGNIAEHCAAYRRIKQLDFKYIIGGHGTVGDEGPAYITQWAQYQLELINTAKKFFDKGTTKENAIENLKLPWRYPGTGVPLYAGKEATEKFYTAMEKRTIGNLFDWLLKPHSYEEAVTELNSV